MRLLIDEQKKKLRERGIKLSDTAIAQAIGVKRDTIAILKASDRLRVSGELLDALCVVLQCTACDLVVNEPVTLPLPPTRPDRRGHPIGTKTKKPELKRTGKRTGVRKGDVSAGQGE